MLHHEMFKIFLCLVTFFPVARCYFQRRFGKQHAFDFVKVFYIQA